MSAQKAAAIPSKPTQRHVHQRATNRTSCYPRISCRCNWSAQCAPIRDVYPPGIPTRFWCHAPQCYLTTAANTETAIIVVVVFSEKLKQELQNIYYFFVLLTLTSFCVYRIVAFIFTLVLLLHVYFRTTFIMNSRNTFLKTNEGYNYE